MEMGVTHPVGQGLVLKPGGGRNLQMTEPCKKNWPRFSGGRQLKLAARWATTQFAQNSALVKCVTRQNG